MLNAAVTVIKRDVKRALRQRLRLLGTLVRPLLWLFVIGTGLSTVIHPLANYPYQTYLLPGLIGMVLLFGGVLSALTTALEKDSGTIRILLLAPFSRVWIVLMRTVSAAVIAVSYVSLFILSILPFGLFPPDINIPLMALSIICIAILWGAVGVLFAVLAKGMENFSLIMNFVVFPLYFLSGGLYPLNDLPKFMKYIIQLNPFSYCVDLIQHAMNMQPLAHYTQITDIVVIVSSTIIILAISSTLFLKKSFEDIL